MSKLTTPSIANKLRASVLQRAIEGKLVPQGPADEPASALLERIRKERAELVKQKKAKAPKGGESVIFRGADSSFYERRGTSAPICIDDEIPFDIPESWEWARLGAVVNIVSARRVHKNDWRSSGVPFYRAREIVKLERQEPLTDPIYIDESLYSKLSESGLPQPGDLMVTGIGTIGTSYVVQPGDRFYYKDASVLCFENRYGLHSLYLKLLMQTNYMLGQIRESSVGTTVATLTMKNAVNYLLPIPPLAEQYRIVERINEIMPLIDQLAAAEAKRDTVNTSFWRMLPQSVLQRAIEGKLVPQDPADEPASVLLERIRKERAELVKQKKAKAPKGGESVIFSGSDGAFYERRGTSAPICIDDEIPFDIPESWEWARLIHVTSHIVDGDHNPPKDAGEGIPIFSAVNVHDGSLHYEEARRWITPSYYEKTVQRLRPSVGSVLLTIVGTIGRTAVLKSNTPFALQRSVCVINPIAICSNYLSILLESYAPYMNAISSGTAQKGVYLGVINQLLVPVPPLAEQQRIVAKVDEIMKLASNECKSR